MARFSVRLFTVAVILTTQYLCASTLTLTQDGVNLCFTLGTFATIDPGTNSNLGPFGLALTNNGNVLVNNYSNNTRYLFADVDGQTPATALNAITPSNSYSTGFAFAGGATYGAANGSFVQFSPDGTVNRVLTGVTQSPWFGMWGNPVNGHILATTAGGSIIDINPLANGGTGSATVIVNLGTNSYDGVSVSPDGTIVYVEQNSHIIGYSIATHAQVFDSGLLSGGPDGIGVITSDNALNGDLIVNFNGPTFDTGFVGLLDPATDSLTTIASGGTRGDYVAPDVTNGTALLDYSDVVYRLGCGADCDVASPEPPITPTPEPVPLGLLALAGLVVGLRIYKSVRVGVQKS